ncbi:hypothetical protein ACFPM3_08500 [Streptomyces coeruleoprunus]|uniref:Uncharacterized protein n=1 Tax=Streptomyces coeruleoprunus TaxID=285563 RepID=A0ABV9XF13_9ACTN
MDQGQQLAAAAGEAGRLFHFLLGLLPDWVQWTFIGLGGAWLLYLGATKLRRRLAGS